MEFDFRALAVLRRLHSAGFEAYFVGGCVRDALRGATPSDYDAATSALPEEITDAFSDRPLVLTGVKHGTVTVVWDGLPVEVTTYRVDGTYADGRRPDRVTFIPSLSEDLARRDFTVNAMAWNFDGVIDPFGGKTDLERGILRCVGDPALRFTEDGLRILRGLRFASVLGLVPDAETDLGFRRWKDRLRFVSAERISEEFLKLLCGDGAETVLSNYPEVFGVFLPELLPCVGFDQRNFHHIYDVYTHLIHTVASIAPKKHLRLAALLHDIAKPQTFSVGKDGVGHFYGHASASADAADEILCRLRVENRLRQQVVTLIRHHDTPVPPDPVAVRRKLNRLGESGFFDLLALIRADNLALSPQFRDRQETYDRLELIAREILTEKQCFSLKDLAVNGYDLSEMGYVGREIGNALSFLLDGVLDGTVKNDKKTLLDYLKQEKSK